MAPSIVDLERRNQASGDQFDRLLGAILRHSVFDECGQRGVVDAGFVLGVGLAAALLCLFRVLLGLGAVWVIESRLLYGFRRFAF